MKSQFRQQSQWLWSFLSVVGILGATSTGLAKSGEGELCWRMGPHYWGEACAPGLDCELSWNLGWLVIGQCVDNRPDTCGGLLGLTCEGEQFCDYEPEANCGRADMTGVCAEQPEICTQEYRPVCGCDGKTYSNACRAHASGVSVELQGKCPPTVCGGIAGIPCGQDEFCNFPPEARCGAADQTGLCEELPRACPAVFEPVCGCDGQTYGNACEARAEGVSVVHDGECAEPACGGLLGLQCEEGEYCKYGPDAGCGFADATGTCEERPEVCTLHVQPVCGCDGKTYSNACAAASSGVSVKSEGPCDECVEDTDCRHGVCERGVTCEGEGCPPPPPNRCTVCGDGDPLRCRALPRPCPDGQVREIVDGCYGECVDRYTCEPKEPVCEVDGQTYQAGERFDAPDGCNECVCEEGGRVSCTEMACQCNYDDPDMNWISKDTEVCSRIRFVCDEGEAGFSNDCGCGCEIVEYTDCRATGCESGSYCSNCWGTFQCIPQGAVC